MGWKFPPGANKPKSTLLDVLIFVLRYWMDYDTGPLTTRRIQSLFIGL